MASKKLTDMGCPFCGQMQIVNDLKDFEGIEDKYIGATVCTCSGAEQWRTKYFSKKRAHDMLSEFQEYAEKKGTEITDADKQFLLDTANSIIDERFDMITVKVEGISIKLKLDKEKALSFNITYKEVYERKT